MDRDTEINIQKTLLSINDVTVKIKKELEIIDRLVRENGHLHMIVNATNEALSKKVQKMEMNVMEIINESKHNDRLEQSLLDPITSDMITDKLSRQMNA